MPPDPPAPPVPPVAPPGAVPEVVSDASNPLALQMLNHAAPPPPPAKSRAFAFDAPKFASVAAPDARKT